MVCNQVEGFPGALYRKSQSPYGAKWFATGSVYTLLDDTGFMSQSPYGAKWFATPGEVLLPGEAKKRRNPLTGLSGLQRHLGGTGGDLHGEPVAIPLRG